jgi:hypothetical protein
MATALRIPLRSARECGRLPIGDQFLGVLYDEIEERPGAAIDYRYALAVFHGRTQALACVVTTETSPALAGLKALPPEVMKTMGLGGEALALWDGSGRRVIGLETFPSIEAFKERALALARQVLGLS